MRQNQHIVKHFNTTKMKKIMMTCAFAAAMLVGAQSVQAQGVIDGQTAKELKEKAKILAASDKAKAAVTKAEKKVESTKKAIEKAQKNYEKAVKDLEKARKKAEEADLAVQRVQTQPEAGPQ